MKFLILAVATLIVAGCASPAPQPAATAPPISPIEGSSIVVKQDLRFLPSLSGYVIPAGTYLPVSRDAHGIYYQSPKGITALGPLGGPYYPVGGIYRFRHRDGSVGLKVWCRSAGGGLTTRELYSMIGANLEKNIAYNE